MTAFESFIENHAQAHFSEIISTYGYRTYYTIITGGYGDLVYQFAYLKTKIIIEHSSEFVVILEDNYLNKSLANFFLDCLNITTLWVPIGIIYQFCGELIANKPCLVPEWKLGVIRPLHIIWYPFMANLLNNNYAHSHDCYEFIFDLKPEQELIIPDYNNNHKEYVNSVLYSKSLRPGKTLLVSVSQNTYSQANPFLYFEVFDLARELGFDVCINGHGVKSPSTKAYSEIGLKFIKIDPFLTPLLMDTTGFALSPSTGIIEAGAIFCNYNRHIHYINKKNTTPFKGGSSAIERQIEPHIRFKHLDSYNYMPIYYSNKLDIDPIKQFLVGEA